ncbi:MAG: Rieske 2Fe-2S domain-containing protein, partial [Terriglobales bacterium]
MADAENPLRQTPDAEMLLGFWYRALPSAGVRGRELKTAMLLGVPLVLGRDSQGRGFALRDSCPHRGMPLSCGLYDGQTLECSYHGWRFEGTTGQCREVPSLTADQKLPVEKIHATAFPCQEQDGFFWVYMPEPGTGRLTDLPPVPRVPVHSDGYKLTHLSAGMPTSVD